MQDKFNKEVNSTSDDDNLGVTSAFQETLAVYFERLNDAGSSSDVIAKSTSLEPQVETLLALPGRLKPRPSDVDSAWMRFKQRSFSATVETQEAAAASLGRYVSQALVQNEASAIVESGLSKSTLEAIKADQTSMDELRGYQLNDYADLARRYGVKDSAFPRMLRWLKGLGKSFSMPSFNTSGGMVFAREEEVRRQGLDEAELAEQLEQPEDTEKE